MRFVVCDCVALDNAVHTPTTIALLGDRVVGGTNDLMWNLRRHSANPQISQQIQLCIEYMRGLNRGEGLGFFLFVGSEDGNRTIKLTPQLVKSGVSVFLFGSIGLFANRNMLREM
jgi:hypothetical protein